MRNERITRKKAPWERPFEVIKYIINSSHQLITTKPPNPHKKHIQLPQLQLATTHNTPKKTPLSECFHEKE